MRYQGGTITIVLLTGAGGLLGTRLAREVKAAFRSILHYHHPPGVEKAGNVYHGDLSDATHVKKLSDIINPDIIINSAALADVDRCEIEPDLSLGINVTAVENLLRFFPQAKLVQISTDYVFGEDEKRGSALPETNDEPGPVNVYGRHKLRAEQAVMSASTDNLVVRVNTLFDYTRRRNFFRFIYDNLKAGRKVSCASDQYSNPISAAGAAALVIRLIERSATGIIHLGGREVVSRHEFARRIAELFGLDLGLIQAVTSEEMSRPARRLKFAGLDCTGTEEFLQMPMPEMKSEFNQIKIELRDGKS